MKNKKILLLAAIIPFALIPAFAVSGANLKSVAATETSISSNEAGIMLKRLDEIKNLKRSDLSSSEKKNLRSELRSMQTKMQSPGVGIYISGGTLILIIILLIILL